MKIEWREFDDPPSNGVFVELSRDMKTPLDRLYWGTVKWKLEGLYWRPFPAPNFLRAEPTTERPPIDEDFWNVVLIEPQQEILTVYRIHELRQELYIPIIRKRVKTGRTGRNGQKVTRTIARPMFPGYGLIRQASFSDDINDLLAVRGVREVLRDKGEPIVLPHEAVLAIFRKQSQKHSDFIQENVSWRKRPRFKAGASVRVEAEGSVYDKLLATIEKDDGKGRVKVLLGMIRHTLPADMVVAA